MNKPLQIGTISAFIANDRRYRNVLEVNMVSRTTVEVVVKNSVPKGGMDGGNDELFWTTPVTTKVEANNVVQLSKQLITVIRHLLKGSSCSIIRDYGKPTRNFEWFKNPDMRGFSVAVVTLALKDGQVDFPSE